MPSGYPIQPAVKRVRARARQSVAGTDARPHAHQTRERELRAVRPSRSVSEQAGRAARPLAPGHRRRSGPSRPLVLGGQQDAAVGQLQAGIGAQLGEPHRGVVAERDLLDLEFIQRGTRSVEAEVRHLRGARSACVYPRPPFSSGRVAPGARRRRARRGRPALRHANRGTPMWRRPRARRRPRRGPRA